MIQPVVLMGFLLLTAYGPSTIGSTAGQEYQTNRLHRLRSSAFRMTALTGHLRGVILVLTAMVAAVVARFRYLTGAALVFASHDVSSRAQVHREYPQGCEI